MGEKRAASSKAPQKVRVTASPFSPAAGAGLRFELDCLPKPESCQTKKIPDPTISVISTMSAVRRLMNPPYFPASPDLVSRSGRSYRDCWRRYAANSPPVSSLSKPIDILALKNPILLPISR